jgi:hypothetical protein
MLGLISSVSSGPRIVDVDGRAGPAAGPALFFLLYVCVEWKGVIWENEIKNLPDFFFV